MSEGIQLILHQKHLYRTRPKQDGGDRGNGDDDDEEDENANDKIIKSWCSRDYEIRTLIIERHCRVLREGLFFVSFKGWKLYSVLFLAPVFSFNNSFSVSYVGHLNFCD